MLTVIPCTRLQGQWTLTGIEPERVAHPAVVMQGCSIHLKMGTKGKGRTCEREKKVEPKGSGGLTFPHRSRLVRLIIALHIIRKFDPAS